MYQTLYSACHRYRGKGGSIGRLDAYRLNNDFIIPAVVDQSGIREEFAGFNVITKDNQRLTGFIAQNAPRFIVLRDLARTHHPAPRGDQGSQGHARFARARGHYRRADRPAGARFVCLFDGNNRAWQNTGFATVPPSMAYINEHYLKLQAGYLFHEIGRRVNSLLFNPDAAARLIRCGIGDVTEALPAACVKALHSAVDEMANRDSFRGYGPGGL